MPSPAVEALTVDGLQGFRCPEYFAAHGIRHVFGGRNQADQGNLALSGGRDRTSALACRNVWLQSLGCHSEDLVVGSQVHGHHVAVVDEQHRGRGAQSPESVIPESDGLFTITRGLPLYIAVADCGGILLSAKQADRRALAVVHAGWRGLVSGILTEAMHHFADAGFSPSNMRAWIAPAIAMRSYEVGPEVGEHAPECAREPGLEDRWQVDIGLWAEESLRQVDIDPQHILRAGLDTGSDERLFSHRRQGVGAGRNGLFAVLAD